MGYQAVYERSMKDPESFWAEAAELIDWDRPWDKVLDSSNAPFLSLVRRRELNTCYNAVDRHVAAGRGDQPAIIYDSPVTGSKTRDHLSRSCAIRSPASPGPCWRSA